MGAPLVARVDELHLLFDSFTLAPPKRKALEAALDTASVEQISMSEVRNELAPALPLFLPL